jgi:hypothetical protein
MDIRKVFEGEAPCDKCDQNEDCKEHEWACRAFSTYIRTGSFEEYTARMPTRHLYNLIFKDDDEALKNYLKKTKGNQDELFE